MSVCRRPLLGAGARRSAARQRFLLAACPAQQRSCQIRRFFIRPPLSKLRPIGLGKGTANRWASWMGPVSRNCRELRAEESQREALIAASQKSLLPVKTELSRRGPMRTYGSTELGGRHRLAGQTVNALARVCGIKRAASRKGPLASVARCMWLVQCPALLHHYSLETAQLGDRRAQQAARAIGRVTQQSVG
jgi:hypothetical protein